MIKLEVFTPTGSRMVKCDLVVEQDEKEGRWIRVVTENQEVTFAGMPWVLWEPEIGGFGEVVEGNPRLEEDGDLEGEEAFESDEDVVESAQVEKILRGAKKQMEGGRGTVIT